MGSSVFRPLEGDRATCVVAPACHLRVNLVPAAPQPVLVLSHPPHLVPVSRPVSSAREIGFLTDMAS